MATILEAGALPDLRYTSESIEAIEIVKGRAGQILRELARQRAVAEHRDLITTHDVIASIAQALQQTADETRRLVDEGQKVGGMTNECH